MADNVQKTPIAKSLNEFAQQKALDAIQQLGRELPASITEINGSIVTVQFEVNSDPFTLPNVTVPVIFPEYVRFPWQVGDKGMVMSADAYLGAISGLGTGTPSLRLPANLSALVFVPLSNKNWFENPDPDSLFMYGKAGVRIWDSPDNNCSVVATDSSLTLTFGSVSIVLSSSGIQLNGNVTSTGTFQNNSVNIGSTHVHGGVTTGGGNSAVPH